MPLDFEKLEKALDSGGEEGLRQVMSAFVQHERERLDVGDQEERTGYSLGGFAASEAQIDTVLTQAFRDAEIPEEENQNFLSALADLKEYVDETYDEWPGGLSLSVSWYESRDSDVAAPHTFSATLQEFTPAYDAAPPVPQNVLDAAAASASFEEFRENLLRG